MSVPSGRFEANIINNSAADPVSVQIRRDPQPDFHNPSGYLSGELYFASQVRPQASFYYFVARSIQESVGAVDLTAELDYFAERVDDTVLSVTPVASGRLEMTAAGGNTYTASLTIAFVSNPFSARYDFQFEHKGSAFRNVECHSIGISAVDHSTTLTPFIDEARGAFSRAGIELTSGAIRWLPTSKIHWSESDLLTLMNAASTGFFTAAAPSHERAWRVLLLLAPRFRIESGTGMTTGIMFDQDADPDDRAPRQGAAAFWDAYPRDAEYQRKLVRTITHELGHCFNLLHPFETASPLFEGVGSRSYMNYPALFKPGEALGYWNPPTRDFSDFERRFMRHAHLRKVVMGGSLLGDGHSFAPDPGDFAPASPAADLRLTLRRPKRAAGVEFVERNPLFAFGEPIRLQARLQNIGLKDVRVDDTLHPDHRRTEFRIRRPDGKFVRFRGPLVRCHEGSSRTVDLAPPNATPASRNSVYEDVSLSYGGRRRYFDEPGRYLVQAIHHGHDGGTVTSNVVDVFIRYPDAVTEDLIVPTMRSDVALYLSGWGSQSLDKAETTLEEFAEKESWLRTKSVRRKSRREVESPPPHPLADEFARCKAYARFNGGVVVRPGNQGDLSVVEQPAKPAEGAKAAAAHFGKTIQKLSQTPFDNVTFGHFLGAWHEALETAGADKRLRGNLINAIKRRFDSEGVPQFARQSVMKRWKLAET